MQSKSKKIGIPKFSFKKEHIPHYLLAVILLVSFILHIVLLVKNPGSNFVQMSPEQIEAQLEAGKLTEYDAKLKEHTWEWGSRDGYLYSVMANQLREHGVYGYDTGNTGEIVHNAFVTYGHPMLLVVIFSIADLINVDQATLVKIFNMFLNLASIFLLYVITAKIFKNRWMGLVASGLYAFYFTPYHFFRTALTETPGIFFYLLAIFLFVLALESNKKRYHFLFAVVFCYAVMIRPVIAPIVLLAYLIVLIKHRSNYKQWLKIAVIWAFGAALVIMPWVVRNYVQFDEFILFSTHSGNSWFSGANPYNLYSFSDYYLEQKELGMETVEYAQMKIKEGFETDYGLWLSWFTVGKTYEMFKIPDAIYFYPGGDLMANVKTYHKYLVILALLTALISRRKETLAITGILLIYLVLSNLFLTIPRYGFFIIPIMCILDGYAIITIIQKIKQWINKIPKQKQQPQTALES
ncbi:glycosyltransferase family 39 protein [Ornithinibacillus scapharcae]|uniref:glycosyltransferase family 39 protein n=1 Tax=Ornithinibacillus scapharcae TaxID=1147159 RepID=UPI000225AA95|nr:glycosyltransferase family 39 protein [Ornithinibacillus scapharcae]